MATDGRQKRIPENMFNDHEAVADVPSRSGAARLAPSVVLLLFVRLLLTLLGRRDRVLIGREALFTAFARLSRVRLQFPYLTAFHAAPYRNHLHRPSSSRLSSKTDIRAQNDDGCRNSGDYQGTTT